MLKNVFISIIVFSMFTCFVNADLTIQSQKILDDKTNNLMNVIEKKYSVDTQKGILLKLNKKIFYLKLANRNNKDKIDSLTYLQKNIKNQLYKIATKKDNKTNEKPIVIEEPVVVKSPKVVEKPVIIDKPKVENNTCSNYYEHKDIEASTFWVWEWADASNGYISNVASAWDKDWYSNFKKWTENSFYIALPYNDFNESGERRKDVINIPWYNKSIKSNESVVKNKWVKVEYNWKVAYGQWEDVWPFHEDDFSYVFWTSKPKNKTLLNAGIDLSPDLSKFIWFDWSWKVNWSFVSDDCIPKWDWTKIITKNNVNW